MTTAEENAKEKAIFLNKYLPTFTPYLDIEKLEKKIPNYRYLNAELQKIDTATSQSSYQHVMSKKKIINLKKCQTIM